MPAKELFKKLCQIHHANKCCSWFEEMWPALKAHHNTPTLHGLSPQQTLFRGDLLGRVLPLSSDCMAMDAKEFFVPQDIAAWGIRQQLEKEHAVQAKTVQKSAAQKLGVGDPVWALRIPLPGSSLEQWFRELLKMPTVSRRALDISGRGTTVNSVPLSPNPRASMCPSTTERPIQTTTTLSEATTLLGRSLASIRAPRWLDLLSSKCFGEATGRPILLGNPSHPSCRGLQFLS